VELKFKGQLPYMR